MIDDSRIKTVLKRYPKNGAYSDASIDLDDVPISEIMAALRISDDDRDARPRLLDEFAIRRFSRRWPEAFDTGEYDYFIHRYLKEGFDPSQNSDIPYPPELGPSENIPRPDGTRWVSIRPSDDGYENWEAWEEH